MTRRVVQGATLAVGLLIAVMSLVQAQRYSWIFVIVGLIIAALALVAMIKNWSIFDKIGPF